MCDCGTCNDIKRWKDVIKNGTVDERFEVFNEMFGRIELAETDLLYYQSILNGSWPNAQSILERKLAFIKEKNAQNLPLTD